MQARWWPWNQRLEKCRHLDKRDTRNWFVKKKTWSHNKFPELVWKICRLIEPRDHRLKKEWSKYYFFEWDIKNCYYIAEDFQNLIFARQRCEQSLSNCIFTTSLTFAYVKCRSTIYFNFTRCIFLRPNDSALQKGTCTDECMKLIIA